MASSYTSSFVEVVKNRDKVAEITFVITANAGDGVVTAISTDAGNIKYPVQTYTELIRGRSLKMVEAFPTVGGTAPDAADVTVKDSDGLDLLNGGGVNLIHATAKKSIYPLISAQAATIPIRGALTIGVSNQTAASANFTLRLTFI